MLSVSSDSPSAVHVGRPPAAAHDATCRLSQPAPTLPGWDLQSILGVGSVAVVYGARPDKAAPDAPFDYALKALRPCHLGDPLAVCALRQEARLGKLVSHANLIPILAARLQGECPLLVMPRLDGATAEAALAARGRFSVPHALWFARQVAQALAAVHAAGWTHGDVKPANIFVSATGHCTLFDLGFATPYGPPTTATGVPQTLKGTIAYLAPELLVSQTRVGPANDIYSLGVTLFQLLTGTLPFNVASQRRLVEAHLRDQPISPRHYVPGLPKEIAQIVQRMLAKTPERRPTAAELVESLGRQEIATFSFRRVRPIDTDHPPRPPHTSHPGEDEVPQP